MKIHVRFEWEVPSWAKNGLRIGLPLLALLGGVGVAWATFTPFPSHALLTSTGLNAALQDLQDQIKKPVFTNRTSGETTSLAAQPCGFTAATAGQISGGTDTGYHGAAQKCAQEAACNSPGPHMCTAEELVRYLATGGDLATVTGYTAPSWFASGVYASSAVGPTIDCRGFNSAVASDRGMIWTGKGDPINWAGCDQQFPIACCD